MQILSSLSFKPYTPSQAIEDSLIEGLLARYNTKLLEDPIAVLKEYEIDYIVVSPDYPFYKETISRLDKSKAVSREVLIKDIYIYRVK